jgi:non-ribosomal peptide synthetase-like protein
MRGAAPEVVPAEVARMTGGSDARTVLDLFERSCAANARRCALEVPGADALTYSELDRRARKVAACVIRQAFASRAPRDSVVAIALPRTEPWLYASILGVMRAGAAYVAIDPSFPARQAAAILADAGAVALIATPERAAAIASEGARIPCLAPADLASADEGAADDTQAAPDSLAYVIYTSGTTGRPKGVEIEHRSLLNLVAGDVAEFRLGPEDRVAQGSSTSYDSSVEEMWLAWAAGGTVVVMDDDTARLGPDLLTWLQLRAITVLCPPPTLLRTLGCDDPERALPRIRVLYVGGEALAPDLAELWSRGRRLENGYGPTECTVTCLRGTVRAGEPVTIGRAIPGSFAAIIDPEDAELREISDASEGELVVGGLSLARGYRGQPETTAARFIDHPTLGRVYRTGDLVHRDGRGDFHYHGRIDAQVKLRGYRIELGAIEAKLAAHPAVLEAACTVEGEGARRVLVAHVVPRGGSAIVAEDLRHALARDLPPYMVPAAIAPIARVPRTVGGKIDRRALPAIAGARAHAPASGHVAPETETERVVARALAAALRQDGEVSVEADLFDDLGLDSLTIAIAISRLRAHEATRAATVRTAYEHRTARAIARAIDAQGRAARPDAAPQPRPAHDVPTGTQRPLLVSSLQALVLVALLLGLSQLLWIPKAGDTLLRALGGGPAGIVALAALAVVAIAGYATVSIAFGVLAKWLLLGRVRPARIRAWSFAHLRHWAAVRCVALMPWELIEAIGLAPAVLSLLGARIGRGVHIHRGVRLNEGGWDLITLEDGATIGQDACLRAVELESGSIVLGPVTVRRNATLETRAGLSPGAELGEGSILRALSNLQPGPRHDHAILDGVPARPIAPAPPPPAVAPAPHVALRIVVAFLLVSLIAAGIAVPWLIACQALGLSPDSLHAALFPRAESLLPDPGALARIACATIIGAVGTVLVQALFVRALGRAPRGPHSLGSFAALRMSLQSFLVEAGGKWLSGTLMWPIWLNLAGARIGRGCEISTITDVVPSTVAIGDETFFADGIYLGGPLLHAGTATIEPIELEGSCFVGNHAVLPAGTRLARETLVGISTRGGGLPFEAGSSWFGHPVFKLPRREVVAAPRELTHDPPLVRRINRWAWEVARFALPIGPVLVALVWFRAMEIAAATQPTAMFRLIALPAGVLASLAALAAAILALKWLLVGRVKPATHPLWSCWCSRWDFLYVAWGMWAAVPLSLLDGTLMLVAYLRAMGCRIGRRALLGSGFAHVVDPDMLHFGDDVTVQALFQAHTFEDRVLKVDHVHIRDRASVGANTVLLYGADIGPGAIVEPHSVVMKREVLLADTRYEGVPTQPLGA